MPQVIQNRDSRHVASGALTNSRGNILVSYHPLASIFNMSTVMLFDAPTPFIQCFVDAPSFIQQTITPRGSTNAMANPPQTDPSYRTLDPSNLYLHMKVMRSI